MTGGRIIATLCRWKRTLAARLPAPMAAPETRNLCQMRISLVVDLVLLALLSAAWEPIAATSLGGIAAFVWLLLALHCLIVGICWLVLKVRVDNAWAARDRDE